MAHQLVIRNGRLVVPELGVIDGHVVVDGGRITELVQAPGEAPNADEVIDADGRYVLPGAIDAHSHYGLLPPIQERIPPESRFGARGGITTMVRYFRRTDSYLETVPPHIETNPALHYQDFSFHLALFNARQIAEIPEYVERLGVTSFKIYMNLKAPTAKAFLVDPLVTDTVMQTADLDYDDGLLMAAMETLRKVQARVRLSVHVEEADVIIWKTQQVRASGMRGLAAWHYARPEEAEALGIKKVAYFSRLYGVPVFFPHIGSTLGIAALEEEAARGTEMVAETCPHYLVQNIQSKAGELLKVMPPVRAEEDNRATWQALQKGVITVLGTDHIPWTREEKGNGDIWTLRPAFGSTGLMVPILVSEGFNRGRLSIVDVARLTSYSTARAFGLYPLKGTILAGSDADLMIIDSDTEWVVDAARLGSAQQFSVYDGFKLKGHVSHTIVRGKPIVVDAKVVAEPGHGRYVRRYPHVGIDGA
ncbi:MAG TPA: amidohydrolase family protein [Candidatus Dormibacteraeota bacterium]|nr:amidohydrolase family protein [Candidatus Dormibacteraeota bacterium]